MYHKGKQISYCLLAALVLASCMKEADTGIPAGMLRANIVQPDEETRTSFDGGTGKFRWSEGDRIAIHMSTGYYTEAEIDYRTGFFSCPTTESRRRDFYAVYPASIAVEGAYGNPDLDVTLPAEYDISDKLTSDYSPLPMIARNREEESDLYFNHAGGLIRIILNDVPTNAARARVSFEHNVTGTFRVHWASEKLPYIAEGGDGAVVTFRLAESTLGAVTNGIRLNVPVPTGHYGEITIEILNSAGTVINTLIPDLNWDCARGHGKLVEFLSTDYTFSGPANCGLNAVGENTATGIFFVVSNRRSSGTVTPVPWTVDGYFADAECTTPYDGEDLSHAPWWLVSLGGNQGGPGSTSSSEDVPITYKAMPRHIASETHSAAAQEINARIEASSFGAGSSPMDYLNLANPSDMRSDAIEETANCYIVNSPGYYRIPLVMGNGITDGVINRDERTYKGTSGIYQVLFKDYKGNNPVNPYLHKTGTGVGTPTSAFIVWEDDEDLVELASRDDYSLAGVPLVLRNDVWWLQFHVVRPVQGNAVIAVADENGDVMWSWHIWQTDFVPKNYGGDQDIRITAFDTSHQYDVTPYALGWVESGKTVQYSFDLDEVYVRLRQAESGKVFVSKVYRYAYSSSSRFGSYAPYFQWGRKDAFWPSNGIGYTVLGAHPDWPGRFPALTKSNQSVTLDEAIRNPGVIHSEVALSWLIDGNSAYNLWSAGRNYNLATYLETIKTIYDPCPAGYCIPPANAFTGFSVTGDTATGTDADVAEIASDRIYYYTDDSRTSTICFPLLGILDCISTTAYFNINLSGEYQLAVYPKCLYANSNVVYPCYWAGYARTARSVRPVAINREVFGGNGDSGATTTGVQVDNYDMGGNMWE